MILIAGLGNPGEKFEHTRHNVGFLAIDLFAKKHAFPAFEFSKKYQALISKGFIGEKQILLAKPQTFMNESGESLQAIVADHRSQIRDIVIVHDEMDMPLGVFKIAKARGSAGHKGVDSLIVSIGNDQLIRIRIGIQPLTGKPQNPESFVVQPFTDEEKIPLNMAIQKAVEALDVFVREGLEKTMNQYN